MELRLQLAINMLILRRIRVFYIYGFICLGLVSGLSCSSNKLDFGPPEFTEDTFSSFEVYALRAEDIAMTTIAVVMPIFESIKLTRDELMNKTSNKLSCSKSTNTVTVNVHYDEKQARIIISKNFPSKEANPAITFDENPLLSINEPGNDTSHLWRQDELINSDFIAVRDSVLSVFKEHQYLIKKIDK